MTMALLTGKTMFGTSQEVRKSGTIERIGFASSAEVFNRYVVLLAGEAAPIVMQSQALRGEYLRMIEHLTLTVPGDEVHFVLKGTTLTSFTNRTLDARLRVG